MSAEEKYLIQKFGDEYLAYVYLVICFFFWACANKQPILVPAEDPGVSLKIHIIRDTISQAYLIESPNGLVLVDTGAPGNESKILKKMKEIGRADLKLILITHAHFDHYGCAKSLRETTGAPIAVHRADAHAMTKGQTPLGEVRSWGRVGKIFLSVAKIIWRTEQTPGDIIVDEGFSLKRFGINAVVLHMPGHTPGSICLVLENNYVFVADLLSSRPWLHVQSYYAHDWPQVDDSLERLKQLKPIMIFPGHGKPFLGSKLENLQTCKKTNGF